MHTGGEEGWVRVLLQVLSALRDALGQLLPLGLYHESEVSASTSTIASHPLSTIEPGVPLTHVHQDE